MNIQRCPPRRLFSSADSTPSCLRWKRSLARSASASSVIRVDGHPLRALGGGVDGVEPDGDFAFEVATNCVQRQAQPLAGFLVLGPVVVMPGAFRVRPVGLEGVGPAVDEEAEVIRLHTGGAFK